MYKVILKNTHSVYQNNVLSAKKPKSSFSVKWNELVSKIWKEIKPTTKSGGLLKIMKKLLNINISPILMKCSNVYTGLFISPSGISELDCATTKTDTAEKSISIGRESLQVFFFVLGALAYLQVPPLEGSRDEKWRSQ